MGTTSKITGTLATAIDKVSGVAISSLANIMGQTISLYSASAYSLELAGDDDYVDCGNDSTIRPTAAITYNAWVYRDDWNDNITPGGDIIMGNFRASSGIYVRWKSKRIQAFARIDGANQQIQTGYNKFKSGKVYHRANGWHMITVTYDGSTFNLYVDGAIVLVSDDGTPTVAVEGVIDYSTGNYDVVIGKQSDTDLYYYDGRIDEVAIWDAALDAAAITAIWNSGISTNLGTNSGDYDNSGDLQGWWRFEEITGAGSNEIVDSSSNSNTATLINGPILNSDVPD